MTTDGRPAAIPTLYRGIRYRSRLEAKWAAFFAAAQWPFTYEPFDGNGYIPDFVIHGKYPVAVEVKPATTQEQYEAPVPKVEKGLAGIWEHRVLILGISPTPRIAGYGGGYYYSHSFGLLGEGCGEDSLEWAAALLQMTECGSLGFCHEIMSYSHSPCGCYDGNMCGSESPALVKEFWDWATNEVQWHGRAA